MWARQRAVQLPVWSQGLLAASSVHLWLLAGGQLSPRLQGQCGCLLLLHRLTAVGTVFLQLCKAIPGCS